MKTYEVVFSPKSNLALLRIFKYVRDDSGEERAENLIHRLYNRALSLSERPERFPLELSLAHHRKNIRFTMVHKFKIVYEILDKEVLIINFFHTKRHPKRILD